MTQRVYQRRKDDSSSSFLIKFFEAFYQELLALKEEALSQIPRVATSETGLPADTQKNIPEKVTDIAARAAYLLEEQAFRASQLGGDFTLSYYREAQYVQAVLADEIFLNLPWVGARYWKDYLVESRIFGTHDAGDLFFEKLDSFLAARDPLRIDMARVYLFALGLNFKGRYRDGDADKKINAYKEKLYIFIYRHEPRVFEQQERLFPDAYRYKVERERTRQFDDLRFWTGLMGSVLGALLLVSFWTWYSLTHDIDQTTSRILSMRFQSE